MLGGAMFSWRRICPILDYSRRVTFIAYHVGGKQVVFRALKGTVFCQGDDHALHKFRDVPPLLETLGQKRSADE